MARLEDITPGSRVSGLTSNAIVQVIAVRWFGTTAIEITGKDDSGNPVIRMLYRTDEVRVHVVDNGLPWSFDIDADQMRLVSEAYRINLAHIFGAVDKVVDKREVFRYSIFSTCAT